MQGGVLFNGFGFIEECAFFKEGMAAAKMMVNVEGDGVVIVNTDSFETDKKVTCTKETTKKVTSTKELAKYVRDIVAGCGVMTDEEKAKMDARIISKLKSGRKLSQKELDYLRKTNPVLYMHAMRVQRKAEALKEQLKHAKSKEEADRMILTATSMVSDKDPDREYIVAAINRVSEEFHKSGTYNKLPDTTAEAVGRKKHINGEVFSDGDDDNDRFELMNWSPLNEVYEMMPTFFSEA